MTNETEAPEYERKGSLATYNLMDALKRNPLLIQAGANICAEAVSTIDAKDARIAELEERYLAIAGDKIDLRGRVAELEAKLAKAQNLLVEYREKTPIGHQPHMIAHRVDNLLAELTTNPPERETP